MEAEESLQTDSQKYQVLFDESDNPVREKDMSGIRLFIEELKGQGVNDFQKYFEKNPKGLKEIAGKIEKYWTSTLSSYNCTRLIQKMT